MAMWSRRRIMDIDLTPQIDPACENARAPDFNVSQPNHPLSSRNMSRCFLSLLLLMLVACGGEDRGKRRGGWGKMGGDIADWRILVEATPVSRGSVASELVTHGSLESEAMADITPEAAGVVTEVRAEEGERVARGQVLAVLSSPSLASEASAPRSSSQARRSSSRRSCMARAPSPTRISKPRMPSRSRTASTRHAARVASHADQPDRRHRGTSERAPG